MLSAAFEYVKALTLKPARATGKNSVMMLCWNQGLPTTVQL